MISIRKYLDWEPRDKLEAYFRTIRLLLEGVRIHAVEQEAVEFERFREEISGAEIQLTEDTPAADVLVLTGKAIKALEEYNRSTTRFVKGRTASLEEIVTMLTRTVTSVAEGSEGSVEKLRKIEFALRKAGNTQDVLVLKSHLADCLDAVQEASKDERSRTSELITELEGSLRKARRDSIEQDSAAKITKAAGNAMTGVLGRPKAEQAILDVIERRRHTFALVVTLPQLATMNARYGFDAGDSILLAVADYLREKLPDDVEIFRWTGASFAVLWEGSGSIEHARRAMATVTASRLSKTLQIGGRSVMVNVGMATTVLALYEFRNAESARKKIDWFVGIKVSGVASR